MPSSPDDDPALYLRDGAAFVGTARTRGGWYADAQSGGAVLALLGHVLEDVPTLTAMSLTRLTVDLVRPVPVLRRLVVRTDVVREGKKIQVVDLVVTDDGVDCVRARALRVRDADLTALDALPAPRPDDPRVAALPGVEDLVPLDNDPRTADFLRYGAEFRGTPEPVDGLSAAWLRLRVPVVAGEPVRDTSRVVMPMDCVNLLGLAPEDLARVTAINADVNGHVFRPASGEWIGLVGGTRFDHGVGHGISVADLRDERGVLGVTSTSQVVQPRG